MQELDPEPRQALIGHSLNVSTLEYSVKRQKLISGSWDKTARIWSRAHPGEEEDGQGWKCEMVLEEHEEAVWGSLAVDTGPSDGCWLTSSGMCHTLLLVSVILMRTADRGIYLWNGEGGLVKRFKGSPEPARGLSHLIDGKGFASACNDGYVHPLIPLPLLPKLSCPSPSITRLE